ncbi:MAG: STAS domain-containing protein [Isosphaeraceae bacterium]|nr:STAS domain-containing protein [Isosphaeraceae bacterium]
MNVRIESIGSVTLITPLDNYLDAGRSKSFRREVVDQLAVDARVILDLSALKFIDSSGCGAILACSRRVNPEGVGPGDLKLCAASRQIRTVFEMVRLHKVLEIFNTREEALHALGIEVTESTVSAS